MEGFNPQLNSTIREALDEFAKAQEALIARMEAKVDLLESMLSSMVLGYAELTAMVETLVEDRLSTLQEQSTEEADEFIRALRKNKDKVIEALQTGQVDAENSFERFTSHSSGTN